MEESKTPVQAPSREEVLREFTAIGKYRVRLVQPRSRHAQPILDIREYVNSPKFQGFTKKGIRLGGREEIDLLRDVLKEVLERDGFAKPAPGTLPLGR